jgi:hypothetical protein
MMLCLSRFAPPAKAVATNDNESVFQSSMKSRWQVKKVTLLFSSCFLLTSEYRKYIPVRKPMKLLEFGW